MHFFDWKRTAIIQRWNGRLSLGIKTPPQPDKIREPIFHKPVVVQCRDFSNRRIRRWRRRRRAPWRPVPRSPPTVPYPRADLRRHDGYGHLVTADLREPVSWHVKKSNVWIRTQIGQIYDRNGHDERRQSRVAVQPLLSHELFKRTLNGGTDPNRQSMRNRPPKTFTAI